MVAAAGALGSLGEDLTPMLFEHFARFAPAARAFRFALPPPLQSGLDSVPGALFARLRVVRVMVCRGAALCGEAFLLAALWGYNPV